MPPNSRMQPTANQHELYLAGQQAAADAGR
jgi:hypothetical protein